MKSNEEFSKKIKDKKISKLLPLSNKNAKFAILNVTFNYHQFIMKNKLLKDFLSDYKEAIAKYNNGEFVFYLRNMRPAIERLSKIIIFDVLNNDKLATDLINGLKSINYDKNSKHYNLSNQKVESKEGASLAFLAKNVIFYKNPHLLLSAKESKRIKDSIEGDCNAMSTWYKKISGMGSHSADDDAVDKAKTLELLFKGWQTTFAKVLTKEQCDFFENLPKVEETLIESFSEKSIIENNDFFVLDSITNRLEQLPGVKYIALLPEELCDRFGNKISPSQLQEFYRLQWNFIIDLNKKTDDGIFAQAPSSRMSSIRIITDNISEVSGVANLTNWLFAKGRIDLEEYDDKQTLRETPKLFSNIFAKIVKTGLTNDYILFDFCDCFPKLSLRLFSKLEDVFGDWSVVQSRCKIISFTKDIKYKKELEEFTETYEVPIHFIEATFGDFLRHISNIKPAVKESIASKLLVRGNSIDLSESRERYRAAGIEFYGPSISKEKRKWDFYSGAEITWDELDKQYDVQRDLYRIVKLRLSEIIRTNRKTTVYTLRHRPGSGATTLAKRIGYDIKKEDELGIISCTVIEVKNCSNIRLTDQYLCTLSEKIDNTPILAIVEAKRVGREKFDNLVKRMSDAGKKMVFLYIEPYTRKYHTPKENVALLDSFLQKEEQKRFEEKYKQLGLSDLLLDETKKSHRQLEVIDFPLMLKDNETSDNLYSYVKEWMDCLPENLKEFCAYVSFVFKYSDLGINQTLLKPIWYNLSHPTIHSYDKDYLEALGKLLIEETAEDGKMTGIWRPRYNRFSTFVFNAYKNNWEAGLSEFSKHFISLCQKCGELGSDDKDMLYSVFIIRKNADYRAIEDKGNLKNKFSLLVKDLDDIERAESLFLALVNAFPEDALFRGHFARFLYEKASMMKNVEANDRIFEEAQEQLDLAFDLNPDDADLFHMQGMLFRRKINALSLQFSRDVKSEQAEVDLQDVEDCLHEWTNEAYKAFEKSIELSPASPYGYAAESQLFKEAILLGQKILKSNDYSFCETNSTYSDYTEKLGTVLDLFEQICYTFKNEGLSQIMNSLPIYESVRLFHQNLVGSNSESIQRYRSMFRSGKGERKTLYGSLLVKSILYSRTTTKDTRRAFSNLTYNEKKEIEDVLEYQKKQGDIKSYETLFMLKLYSRDEFSLDEAIDLLKEWERQFTENGQSGWGYLNACFYLAVCYCSKSIIGKVKNLELSSLAMSYFSKSEEFAKKFDKGTVHPQCYFGERNDIHCIVDKYRKDLEATTITGVIHNIKNNKGILRMQCGVDVTFNAKGFDIMRDEGQTLRGVLGFSYSGPGLYDFRPDTDAGLLGEALEVQEEKEISVEELEKSYTPIEDLVEETKEQTNDVRSQNDKPSNINLKLKGKIDLDNNNITSSFNKERKRTKNRTLKIGEEYEGVVIAPIYGSRKNQIKCKEFPYPLDMEINTLDKFYEDEEVFFTAGCRPHANNKEKVRWYAYNIRLKENE